jgi:ABC-type dipeptide/oligopeptide/nickel transport system ATPase component
MIPILSVHDLKVSIRTDQGTAAILDNVSLTVETGRILGSSASPAVASPR